MAVGDLVGGIAASGVVLTFQPAASVSVTITTAFCDNAWVSMTDGTTIANCYHGSHSTGGNGLGMNEKFMITNSIYLHIDSGNQKHFTGIQIA
tara:strand:- start:343 stop:621 length:279 start_codon:yes stop_codon:yes gene_type:complete